MLIVDIEWPDSLAPPCPTIDLAILVFFARFSVFFRSWPEIRVMGSDYGSVDLNVKQTRVFLRVYAKFMHIDAMLLQDICLSVTRRHCVETAKHIVKLFPPSCSQTL